MVNLYPKEFDDNLWQNAFYFFQEPLTFFLQVPFLRVFKVLYKIPQIQGKFQLISFRGLNAYLVWICETVNDKDTVCF